MGRILAVTGATGFVGEHVVRQAHDEGYRVWAVGREIEPPQRMAAWCDRYIGADLAEGWPVLDRVDAVIHLAGLAAVGPSFAHPQRYIEVNSAIMTAMCESLLSTSPGARVVVVSSGSVYRADDGGAPIDETSPTSAGSPYAVAKLLVERQAEYYAHRGLDTLVARPFNHIGPGQGPGFLIPDLAAGLNALAPGDALSVGNLATSRDYTDVRDVARAYLTLVAAPTHRHPVYNVSSGASRSGREVLSVLADALGVAAPAVTVDESRIRPGDPLSITGSAARLREEFDWRPRIDWTDSVRDYAAGLTPGGTSSTAR